MTEMRILTVRQPWAWAIIHGAKNVENRLRNIAGDYRGPVAIHVGKVPAGVSYRQYGEVVAAGYDAMAEQFLGSIIGVVELRGVHRGHNTDQSRMKSVRSCYQAGKPFGPCSGWALPDHWHLELANPLPLAHSIPFKGALGLRKLEPVTIAQIEAQL